MEQDFHGKDLMSWQEMSTKIRDLEAKVESLTRSLELFQDVLGVEVYVVALGTEELDEFTTM